MSQLLSEALRQNTCELTLLSLVVKPSLEDLTTSVQNTDAKREMFEQ